MVIESLLQPWTQVKEFQSSKELELRSLGKSPQSPQPSSPLPSAYRKNIPYAFPSKIAVPMVAIVRYATFKVFVEPFVCLFPRPQDLAFHTKFLDDPVLTEQLDMIGRRIGLKVCLKLRFVLDSLLNGTVPEEFQFLIYSRSSRYVDSPRFYFRPILLMSVHHRLYFQSNPFIIDHYPRPTLLAKRPQIISLWKSPRVYLRRLSCILPPMKSIDDETFDDPWVCRTKWTNVLEIVGLHDLVEKEKGLIDTECFQSSPIFIVLWFPRQSIATMFPFSHQGFVPNF